jgi:hypothetical protein
VRTHADLIFSFLLFVVLIVLFFLASATISMNQGLSSADDGFFALAAKSFSMGTYGLPLSSHEVSRFDPWLGSGPVLIGLGALATFMFGPQDSLGLLPLTVFILQLVLILALLRRRFSWASVLGCGFTGLFLLTLASGSQWYFGTFIGEVPTFGFVLLGVVLLTTGEHRSWQIAAGISFGLAFLTKQISLFAVIGALLSWLLFIMANKGISKAFANLTIVITAMTIPPILYEIAKLISLGLEGYVDLWRRMVQVTKYQAIGDVGDRFQNLLVTLSSTYGPVWILTIIIFSFAAILAWRVFKKDKMIVLPLVLLSGVLTYFAYITIASTMWPRYFWIGVALLTFACGATILILDARVRWFIIVILIVCFGFHNYANVDGIVKWSVATSLSEERSKILIELSKYPETAIAGRSWHSFYDIVYLMDSGRVWVTERDIALIQSQKFIAVLNSAFGDKTKFFNVVTGNCETMLSGNRYTVYSCGNMFWRAYDAQ